MKCYCVPYKPLAIFVAMMGLTHIVYTADTPLLEEQADRRQAEYNNLKLMGEELYAKYETKLGLINHYDQALEENIKEQVELDKKRSFIRALFDNPDIGLPSDTTLKYYDLIDARAKARNKLNRVVQDLHYNKNMQTRVRQDIIDINDALIETEVKKGGSPRGRVPSTKYYFKKKSDPGSYYIRPLHRQFKYAKHPTTEQINAYEMFKPGRVLKVEPTESWWKRW